MASNAIDMELKNTDSVFNCSSAVFSGKNCNIIYPILKYSTKYFILFLSCTCFFSTNFAGFHEVLLIARSCVIFGQEGLSESLVIPLLFDGS